MTPSSRRIGVAGSGVTDFAVIYVDNILIRAAVTPVLIDIKPGSEPNCYNITVNTGALVGVVQDEKVARIYREGLLNPSALTDLERIQFHQMLSTLTLIYKDTLDAFDKGLYDQETYEAWQEYTCTPSDRIRVATARKHRLDPLSENLCLNQGGCSRNADRNEAGNTPVVPAAVSVARLGRVNVSQKSAIQL